MEAICYLCGKHSICILLPSGTPVCLSCGYYEELFTEEQLKECCKSLGNCDSCKDKCKEEEEEPDFILKDWPRA
jgi:hypothetical protein